MGGIRGDYSRACPGESRGRLRVRRSNRGTDVEQLWRFRRIYDYVTGDHMWTGIDYLGEAAVAYEELGVGSARYLRLREGRLLFLSEPVDR